MSCNGKEKTVAGGAAIAAGVTAQGSRIGHATGALLNQLRRGARQADVLADQAGRLTTPVTAALTRRQSGPALKQAAATATAAAGQLPGRSGRVLKTAMSGGVLAAAALLPPARAGLRIARVADGLTAAMGTAAAATTMTDTAGKVTRQQRRLIFFKSTRQVALWKSGLTGAINRRDVVGTLDKDNVRASDGVMFETGGKTWHRGTTVVRMPAGERTITHLQSLNAMADHYYFDRPLSDEQAVDLARGQIKPETTRGYVGRVSPAESLCPALAAGKRLLFLARLHWPPQEDKV